MNCGLTIDKRIFSIGINYFFTEYINKSNNKYSFIVFESSQVIDTINVYNYNYKLSHRFFCIPISYQYLIGKNDSWQIGCTASLGKIYSYQRSVESSITQIKRKIDLDKNFLLTTLAINLAKKLIDTNNFVCLIDLNIHYTSTIGTKGKIQGTPYETKNYTSKPHHLIFPLIGFNSHINYNEKKYSFYFVFEY